MFSNACHAQNDLENGKILLVVLCIPWDMLFDGFKQSSRECNSLGNINFSSELVALIY
jgi:hypothetical protein